MDTDIKLVNSISLEGPFLEKVWAAYQLMNYREVVPRYETLGTHHDVLVKLSSHHILYECTGQYPMTRDKINRLRNDAFDLADRLTRLNEPPLKEVVLVSSCLRNAWSEDVRGTFENARKDLEKSKGIKLYSIEDYDLLYELIRSGVLGLRLIDNRIYFIGPDDYGIRFDREKKEFIKDFSKLDMQRFYQIPHSFLPSHYWEQRYRKLIEESMEGKLEGTPLWTYEWQYGVSFEGAKDFKNVHESIYRDGERFNSEALLSDDKGYVRRWWSRRYSYYEVHIFDVNQFVSRDVVSALKGYAMELMRKIRDSEDYLEGQKFTIYIYSASESWSPLAWAEAQSMAREDVEKVYVKRGNESLLELLNQGALGLAYREKNQITLVGPKQPAIRRNTSTAEGLEKPS